MFLLKDGKGWEPNLELGRAALLGRKVRCWAELAFPGEAGGKVCLGAAADTGVLLLPFQCFLYQIGSKLTLPGRAHVSSWQPGPAQLAGSAQSPGPAAAGSSAELRSELGSALLDEPKAGGASPSPKPSVRPCFSESNHSPEVVVCPGEAVGKQDKIHIPWFELTVQEGVGGGKRSTGKSNRVKLR